ncbi:MAG: hypothetical protein HUU55_13930 [Myxococcales bacterium]|nr:hypothetical protein [Myxococcales bacterium]
MYLKIKQWVWVVWVVLMGTAEIGCGGEEADPQTGSESHFLQSCDLGCGDGLSCVCGVCTQECGAATQCGVWNAGATCAAAKQPVWAALCGGEVPQVSLCLVECETSQDCGELGDGYVCELGLCVGAEVVGAISGGADGDGLDQIADDAGTDAGGVPTVDGGQDGEDGAQSDVGLPEVPLSECTVTDGSVVLTPTVYLCDCADGAVAECVPGDDANDGESPATPLRTLGAAFERYPLLPSGGAIAICRGGVIVGDAAAHHPIFHEEASAENPRGIRDYSAPWGTPTMPRPVVMATKEWPGLWLEAATPEGQTQGYVVQNVEFRGDAESMYAIWIGGGTSAVVVCGVLVDGFYNGIRILARDAGATAVERGKQVTIVDSHIRKTRSVGVLGIAHELTLDRCVVENTGTVDGETKHAVWLRNDTDVPVTKITIRNTKIIKPGELPDGKCSAVGLMIDGLVEDIEISQNEFLCSPGKGSMGFRAIQMGTFASKNAFYNVLIAGNELRHFGAMGIAVEACQGCGIENNVLVAESATIDIVGIVCPTRTPLPDEIPIDKITIRNNSVLIPDSPNGTGIRLGEDGSGHVVVSNTVMYGGDGPFGCYPLYPSVGETGTVDHNHCWAPNVGPTAWHPNFGDLAGWQTASNSDINSKYIDPQYTNSNIEEADLTPSNPQSPLVGSGHPTLSTTTDIEGKPRGESPNIGAYEL